MKRALIALLLATALSHTANAGESEKMRIAVMDLKSDTVSPKTTSAVSNILRTELTDAGIFTVIERSQIDTILNEQGLQQTGCTDQACVVEMGKLLSARKMLVGELSAIGGSIIITVRIVDVEKGVSEFGSSVKAESEEKLDSAVQVLAGKLVSRIENHKEKSPSAGSASMDGYYPRAFVPGWAQFHTGHPVKGTVIGTLFLASAVWATLAVMNYNKSRSEYDNLGPGLAQEEYDSAFDRAKKDGRTAIFSLAGVSIIYAFNWVDALYFSKPAIFADNGIFRYEGTCLNLNFNNWNFYENRTDMRTDISFSMKF